MRCRLLSGISPGFPELSQSQGQVTHVLLTRSPLIPHPKAGSPLDLHVLSTPPAFILSQDQTLHQGHTHKPRPKPEAHRKCSDRAATPDASQFNHPPGNNSTPGERTTRGKEHPRAVQGSSIIRTMPFHQTRQTPARSRNHEPRHPPRMTGLIGTGFSHTVEFSRSAVIAPDGSPRFPLVCPPKRREP